MITIHKKNIIILFCLIIAICINVHCEPHTKHITVQVSELGIPRPSQSRLACTATFDTIAFVKDPSLKFLYIADTSYLFPSRFYELSGILRIPLILSRSFGLYSGAGAGLSSENGAIAISGIGLADIKLYIVRWLAIELEGLCLAYPDGYIIAPDLSVSLELFNNSLIASFGLALSYASLYSCTKSVFGYQLRYGLGFSL